VLNRQDMEKAPSVRMVCISDTHNFHSKIDVPDGDVLIIAGDVCVHGSVYELAAVNEFLGSLPHRHKLLVAGNHDWCFANLVEREEARRLLKNAIYLEDSGVEINGVKYWGSPWQPEFHHWAFNLPRGPKLAEVWAKIPSDTDVLITHTPPFSILDKNGNGDHCGCGALLDALNNRVQPRIHVFGHVHESYGTLEADGTTFINASICDGQYRPINPPIVIDLRLPA
jgi:Icc-related predicted phosphoesterase